jgi:outer membrane murein-binding lipoprotein Lpp
MNTDDKLVKILEELHAGQKALQGDVKTLTSKVDTLEQGQKALAAGQEQQGKLLNGIAATMASVLEEQQAQRIDIRSLHTELHETREELKGEIRAAREEAKRDNIDLKATVVKKIQSLDRRTTNLEEQAGIENPEKH